METSETVSAADGNETAARREIGTQAAFEITSISQSLMQAMKANTDDMPYLLRGMSLRLATLGDVVLGALGDDTDCPLETLHWQLYGESLQAQKVPA